MWPAWLRQVARRLSPRTHAPLRRTRPRLRLEQFEDRTVPATITWTNAAGGDWSTAGNWDLNRAPTTGDDVVIPDLGAAGPSILITTTSSGFNINSLTTRENVRLTFGNFGLIVTGDIAINGGATVTLAAVPGQSQPLFLDFNSSNPAANQRVTSTGGGTLALTGLNLRDTGTAHTVTVGTGVTVNGGA